MCTKWLQSDLEQCGVKYTSIPGFQNPIRPVLQAAIFKLQAILRQLHRLNPKDLEHYKGKGTPIVLYK